MKHLINPLDFTVEETEELLLLAEDIMKDRSRYSELCHGKKLATLFYEPSTRTRLSFEAAMLNLGGSVLGFSSGSDSSASLVAATHSSIPVINAGDGGHQHPTQTLTDLLTIHHLKGRLDNLTIGLCGDLKFGRTVHSLISALVRYPKIKFVLISPEELKIPSYIRKEVLQKNNMNFIETEDLEEVMPELDILYMTRVQRERFFNEEDYIRLKDKYILDMTKMALAKKDMLVLHPLPRVNEISVEVDNDPRAAYFKQAECGVYVRMALIMKLLGVELC